MSNWWHFTFQWTIPFPFSQEGTPAQQYRRLWTTSQNICWWLAVLVFSAGIWKFVLFCSTTVSQCWLCRLLSLPSFLQAFSMPSKWFLRIHNPPETCYSSQIWVLSLAAWGLAWAGVSAGLWDRDGQRWRVTCDGGCVRKRLMRRARRRPKPWNRGTRGCSGWGERDSGPSVHTRTNRHTHKHECVHMCGGRQGGREKHSIRNSTLHTLDRVINRLTDWLIDRQTDR